MKSPGPRVKDAAALRQVLPLPGTSVVAFRLFSEFSGMAGRFLTTVMDKPLVAGPEVDRVSHRTAVRAVLEISQFGGDSC